MLYTSATACNKEQLHFECVRGFFTPPKGVLSVRPKVFSPVLQCISLKKNLILNIPTLYRLWLLSLYSHMTPLTLSLGYKSAVKVRRSSTLKPAHQILNSSSAKSRASNTHVCNTQLSLHLQTVLHAPSETQDEMMLVEKLWFSSVAQYSAMTSTLQSDISSVFK